MFSFHDLLVYFLKAWADVSLHLLFLTHEENEVRDWPVDNYQWGVVILSICFFYMVCFLIHKLIEDWVKLIRLKKDTSKLIDYNDGSNQS